VLVAACAIASLAQGGPASASVARCRDAIRAASGKLATAQLAALAKCQTRRLAAGSGTAECESDARVEKAVQHAQGKLRATIAKHCAGPDRACGGDDDEPLKEIGWNMGTCPALGTSQCAQAIDDCDDVASCLACASDGATDRLAGALLGTLTPPANDKVLGRCQRVIARAMVRFFGEQSDALAACWHDMIAGKPVVTGPCPDGDETGATQSSLERAETRLAKKTCKACGGADRTCGGADDLSPATIGFPAACPDARCDAAVTRLPELVDCVVCATHADGTCLDAFGVPWSSPDLAQCGAAPLPVCGDGLVNQASEECDPPSDDACPGACLGDCTCSIPALCGNALVEPGEECDGGGCPAGRACLGDCTCEPPPPECGNGIVEAGEDCDQTSCPAGGTCQTDCTCAPVPTCGDGIVDPGEQCDGTGCPEGTECLADCTCADTLLCGNGVVDPGEQCDASDCAPGAVCQADCTCAVVPGCGNGVVDPGEECDGTGCSDGEECLIDCTCSVTPTCGDGIVQPGEECDASPCPVGECTEECVCS